MTDLRLKCSFRILLCGGSSTGKTNLAIKILSHSNELYDKQPGKVLYFYKSWQPLFQQLKENGIVDSFIQNMPKSDFIKNFALKNPNTTVVLDDMSFDVTEDTLKIFNVISHHSGVNVIFLTQNLFWKNKWSRDISLSSTHIILTKNIRDKLQISSFAAQFDPTHASLIRQMFTHATMSPYSYAMFDLSQTTPDNLRIKSNLFLEDGRPIRCYLKSTDLLN